MVLKKPASKVEKYIARFYEKIGPKNALKMCR